MAGTQADKSRGDTPKPKTCTVSIEGAFLRAQPSPYAPINDRTSRYQELELADTRGHVPVIHNGRVLWAPLELGMLRGSLLIVGRSGQLLVAPGGSPAATVAAGSQLQMADIARWLPVMYQGSVCWISRQFTMD